MPENRQPYDPIWSPLLVLVAEISSLTIPTVPARKSVKQLQARW